MRVIARIKGGIGNQLFCYAAARRLAIMNNAELVLDDVSGFSYDYAYKRDYQLDFFNISANKATPSQRMEPYSRIRRFIVKRISRLLSFNIRKYIQQEGVDFDARMLKLRPKRDIYLDGYWQSEDYFKDVEQVIRADLYIKPPIDRFNLEMALKVKSLNSIAVHVRYFDVISDGSLNNISKDYYCRAVNYMKNIAPDAHYFIFSDNPMGARKQIPLPDSSITLVNHNQVGGHAFADLWLMTKCNHFIIANSTFSWWGAWLADYPNKIVIAPGVVLNGSQTAWGFKGLIPESWIKL